jgi:hypothetical protein
MSSRAGEQLLVLVWFTLFRRGVPDLFFQLPAAGAKLEGVAA